ncbi:MAG: sugar phosphate nucleotidyltransferase [Bacteroidota bacterium]
MNVLYKNIIAPSAGILDAMNKLGEAGNKLTLFVLDDDQKLIGTLTDKDIRQGLIAGKKTSDTVEAFMCRKFRFLREHTFTMEESMRLKADGIKVVPLLDKNDRIVRLIDFDEVRSALPFDVVLMAGGRGERLKPLTDATPKSLLMVGDKPILEHNIDRLMSYGISEFIITIRYMAQQVMDYFGNGDSKGIDITYIKENLPMGTIGSISLIEEFTHDHVLIVNSDLLTDIDYEAFYKHFIEEGADMAIASAPYQVKLPFIALHTEGNNVTGYAKRPMFNYNCNAGVYLIKRELLKMIPVERSFNATDFMNLLFENGNKLTYFPISGYWLDISEYSDYMRANEDIKYISK